MRKSKPLTKDKPLVRNNLLLVTGGDPGVASPVPLGTPQWYAWLADHSSFVFEGSAGRLNARREVRRGGEYWYAYRRRGGKLYKTYLGRAQDLTQARLEQASARLAGQTPLEQLSSQVDSASLTALRDRQNVAGAETDLSLLPMTRVQPPPLPRQLIARPRLTQRISAPVTLVCAPSGFGKSTLLNEWRKSCGMPVAWVALDADDNHPLRFWSKVVTALQTVNPSLGQSWLALARASLTPALSTVVVNLTNDIVRVTDEPIASQGLGLVLDNYHHIQNTEIHTSLQTLLEHIPRTLKLAVASNTKPPLALGYLTAKGMVVELGTDDLRFTLEEGVEFLLQYTPGPKLAYSDMQALVKRTEGWITGLVLATCALTQQDDRARFVETLGAHPPIREFFTESALHGQPWEVHTFLLKTSLLKHLTGLLCDAVVAQSGSGEMLARLFGENLFLERLGESDWYRYHDLFAETLRARLHEQFPAQVPGLHLKAAQWYQEQDDPTSAIHHLLAGKAWEEAAALIENAALRELEQFGEDSRLLRWLQQLPEAVVQQNKALLAVYIRLASIALQPAEVESLLARIESEKTGAGEIQKIRRLWVKNDQEASELSADGDDAAWQMLNGILQCYRDYRRDLVRAEARASAIYETAKARRHLYAILMAGGGCADLALSRGHLRQSEQIANEVLRQALELRGKLPEPASIAITALGNVHFMRNQLTQAHQLLVRATEVNPNPASTNDTVMIAVLRAKTQSAQGDNEAAFATIQAARELHARRPSSIWLEQDLIAYQELFRMRQGDLASAERLLGEGGEVEANPFSALVRAEILIEQRRNVAAEEILRHLLKRYPQGSYLLPIMRARVILAMSLLDQGKVNQARQVMAKAARLAAPEFFIRPFLDYGNRIASLLSLVLHTVNLNAGARSFLKGVLTMLGHDARGLQEISLEDEPMALAIAASISPREQQVLRLLSAGLSNRQIAARFSISASTVKTHLENIYHKLGVSSRTQAIAQAHALKLL